MRVILVAEDIRRITGGVPTVVRELSRQLTSAGIDVHVAYAFGGESDLVPGTSSSGITAGALGRSWAWSKALKPEFDRLLKTGQSNEMVVHIHGIWAAPQYLAARCAYRAGVPFVLTPHGMLEPWLWNEQGRLKKLKKSTYWRLFAYPVFRHASIIHAITKLERDNLRELFPENRIEIIPNAVDSTTQVVAETPRTEKRIAFLGRIDPKKAVDILIEAFADAGLDAEWRLDIAGPSWSAQYSASLRTLVKQLGLEHRISFLGPLFGAEKAKFLQSAWILATPSHSEAIGLVNLEAAMLNTPAITTPQTGLFDWEDGGGVLVKPCIEAFAAAIRAAANWDSDERTRRGQASRSLVERRYSWKAVLPAWLSLYESLVD